MSRKKPVKRVKFVVQRDGRFRVEVIKPMGVVGTFETVEQAADAINAWVKVNP